VQRRNNEEKERSREETKTENATEIWQGRTADAAAYSGNGNLRQAYLAGSKIT
jgi:hypothetical protein